MIKFRLFYPFLDATSGPFSWTSNVTKRFLRPQIIKCRLVHHTFDKSRKCRKFSRRLKLAKDPCEGAESHFRVRIHTRYFTRDWPRMVADFRSWSGRFHFEPWMGNLEGIIPLKEPGPFAWASFVICRKTLVASFWVMFPSIWTW